MANNIPPLWKHQAAAIERAVAMPNGRFALMFDPGVGKTRTALEIYQRKLRHQTPLGNKILIFAPLNVCRNWQTEIFALFSDAVVYVVAGQSKATKKKLVDGFSAPVNEHDRFLICNIELLRSKEYVGWLSSCGAKTIIVDEAHNFKTPTSNQTKGLFAVQRALDPKLLLLLTGTPAPQGEIDLWSTFALLGRTSDSFFVWRKKWFDDKNERRRGTRHYWPDYAIRESSKIRFQQELELCSAVAKKDEVLDLPELLRTTLYTELSKTQKQHYDSMKEYLFAIDAEGNELNASNVLSRTLRLQQILAGWLGEIPIYDNPRLDTLDAAVEKVGKDQFIIWTIFKATYSEIGARLRTHRVSFEFLTGEQTPQQRFNSMEAFSAGHVQCLIAHPKAGGVGVNLVAANYSIHYTRSFSLVDDLQAEARNYRGGSERHNRITRIDIVAPDTIDEEIVTALRQKKTAQEFVMGLRAKQAITTALEAGAA